jgi:glutamyl-tRNA reductase
MVNNFKALVLTYKTAPVAVREHVSLTEAAGKRLMTFMREYTSASEVLVVSTCNRTEVYYYSENDHSSEILKGISLIKQVDQNFDQYFVSLHDQEAIQHLFEVAIGLDAQVIGDLQISGQVKRAYQWSVDESMAGPFLHRLLHTIFFVNKRVVQETSFRDGAASISYAAKELAEDLTESFTSPRVLVVGVGEIGQDVCLNLQNSHLTDVTIINRTLDKAEALAKRCGFKYGGIDNLAESIQHADLIISSVSGSEPLITKAILKEVSILSYKFFIDLSMPRSIESDLGEIPGVIVYNLDDLQEKTNEAVVKRKASIPKVLSIIDEALVEFNEWSKEMVVSPTIQKLKTALEQIRTEELARYIKHAKPEEVERLDEMSKSLMQKILKFPVLQLKAACKRGEAETLSELLSDLFNLDKVEVKK